jgi:hypothetical protein
MADLAPALRHPTLGATMRELWQQLDASAPALTPVDLGWTPPVR